MRDGLIGLIDTPKQGSRAVKESLHDTDVVWCADNGCFSEKWDEAAWWAFLLRNAHRADSCLFAVAPDVVGDAAATLVKSAPWLSKIRALGYPVAFVAQDGLTIEDAPWAEFQVLFLGGTTAWKLGPEARSLAAEAKRRGLWVHMGRVNSEKRYRYALAIGCDSADGTKLVFGPDTNLPQVLAWSRSADQAALFEGWSA
jgi:hypothetical protein